MGRWSNRLIRPVKIEGCICIVPLSQGKVAICDREDYDLVCCHNWFAHKRGRTFYACFQHRLDPCVWITVFMHRLILGDTADIDHRDGDGLNNRRSNLRFCSDSENLANSRLFKSSLSGFKGVTWRRKLNKWQARIRSGRREVHLGVYSSVVHAAQVYNEAAIQRSGEFAKVNEFEK